MANEYLAYIGTYTSLGAEGIYCYRFDMATGGLEYVNTTGAIDDPSFLDIAPSGKYLYAVCADFEAMTTGIIRAYSIDADTGELTLLNEQSSEGTGPCHVEVDQTSRYVLLANYGSGSVASYPIQEDGSLGKATGFVQHQGSSIDPERQEGPHGHSINIDPTNTFAFAADLGIDKVLAYRINHDDGSITPADSPYTRTPPGGGPRHFAFHPNGKHAYLLNEMGSSVTAMHYDGSRGMLNEIETLTTLPDDFDGVNHCADIHVSPDGEFVYASNRGHDSIAVIRHRPGHRRDLLRGTRIERRRDSAKFRPRPVGDIHAGLQSGHRQHPHLPHQPRYRDAGADGPRGRCPRSRLHQAPAGLGLTCRQGN